MVCVVLMCMLLKENVGGCVVWCGVRCAVCGVRCAVCARCAVCGVHYCWCGGAVNGLSTVKVAEPSLSKHQRKDCLHDKVPWHNRQWYNAFCVWCSQSTNPIEN